MAEKEHLGHVQEGELLLPPHRGRNYCLQYRDRYRHRPVPVPLVPVPVLVHSDLVQLVVEDPRREAWFAVDNLSSQWVTAWPTAKHRLTAQEFPEVASSYLGTMSPIVRPFAGQTDDTMWARAEGLRRTRPRAGASDVATGRADCMPRRLRPGSARHAARG